MNFKNATKNATRVLMRRSRNEIREMSLQCTKKWENQKSQNHTHRGAARRGTHLRWRGNLGSQSLGRDEWQAHRRCREPKWLCSRCHWRYFGLPPVLYLQLQWRWSATYASTFKKKGKIKSSVLLVMLRSYSWIWIFAETVHQESKHTV